MTNVIRNWALLAISAIGVGYSIWNNPSRIDRLEQKVAAIEQQVKDLHDLFIPAPGK